MGKILEQAFYKRGIPNVSYLTKQCSTSNEIQLYSDQLGKSGPVLQCCLCHEFRYTRLNFWTLNSVLETLHSTSLESKPLSYVEMEEEEFLLHKIRRRVGNSFFFLMKRTTTNSPIYLLLLEVSGLQFLSPLAGFVLSIMLLLSFLYGWLK